MGGGGSAVQLNQAIIPLVLDQGRLPRSLHHVYIKKKKQAAEKLEGILNGSLVRSKLLMMHSGPAASLMVMTAHAA